MSASASIQGVFESAKQEFLQNLKDAADYDFSQFTSIDKVYEATEKIQEEQGKTNTLRNLKRIQPYLDGLNQYAGVFDTFIQAKPEILTFIWGPIKLLLLISSTFLKSWDALLEAMAQIGDSLPQFQIYGDLFNMSQGMKHALCIFYSDILEFHVTILNFFRHKKWSIFFESLWPRYAGKISVILHNIRRHKLLVTDEVTLANITEAYKARERAYEEYDKNQQNWDRSNFEEVNRSIAPNTYDHELERFSRKCNKVTGEWLRTEDAFCGWFDLKNSVTRIIWLVGIPGAGKTYLSSVIIRGMMTKTLNTLFAILSHQNTNTTTLQVLHSLTFQLLVENKHLQPIVIHAYQSNSRQLSSSADFVQSLLYDLVKGVESVCIIIDGLDEIKEPERQALLFILLKLANDNANLKLLISSRDEADISRLLRTAAQRICIGNKNLSDIEAFVISKANEWLLRCQDDLEREIDSAKANEIREMFQPVATKAEGMFLYARLVLDTLMSQTNIHDLRDEVNNLPQGLDEAYDRIRLRIDKTLRPNERQEAKSILEWIGCSPFPLKRKEIEHALTIRIGDNALFWDRFWFRNMVQLCGPIIEFQDEYVVFVHFTVKEYIFGSQSNFFLERVAAHRNIAITCMSYLAFKCFDVSLDDSAIDDSILAGEYMLQAYAEGQWLEHVKQCTQDMPDSSMTVDICQVLDDFLEQRANPNFKPPLDMRKVSSHSFVYLQLFSFYDTLRWISSFVQEKRQVVSVKNGPTWIDDDPLLVSAASVRIWQRFDFLACPSRGHLENSLQLNLVQRYGPQIFRCDRPACNFYRIGFASQTERKAHIKSHDRVLRCSFSDCDLAHICFSSQSLLDQHLSETHRNRDSVPTKTSLNEPYHPQDLQSIFLDAIEAEELICARKLLERIPDPPLSKAMKNAIHASSVPAVRLLLEFGYAISTHDGNLLLVINSKEVEILRVFLEHGANRHNFLTNKYFRPVDHTFAVKSPESMKLLIDYGADIKLQACNLRAMYGWNELGPEEELMAIQCIQILLEHTASKSAQSELLLAISVGCQSIDIARYLLENGADINYINTRRELISQSTAMYFAARRVSQRSAEFLKFLLQSGADPNIKCRLGKLAGERPGARNISKYLGMTWDELCQSTSSVRRTVNPVISGVPAQSNVAVRSADYYNPVSGDLPLRPLEPFSMDSGNQSQQERPLGQEESSTSKRRRLD